jgi:MCP family monocarboxylic acid transporter-like MFS transporter 10
MFVLFLAGFTYRPLVSSAKDKESEGRRFFLFSRRKFSPPKKIFNFTIFKVTAYAVWAVGIPLALFGYFVPYVHLVSMYLWLCWKLALPFPTGKFRRAR